MLIIKQEKKTELKISSDIFETMEVINFETWRFFDVIKSKEGEKR